MAVGICPCRSVRCHACCCGLSGAADFWPRPLGRQDGCRSFRTWRALARSASLGPPGRVRRRFGGFCGPMLRWLDSWQDAGNSNQSTPWPGDKRVSAPGRVRHPAREDALAPYHNAHRQKYLPHKPSGTIVVGVHPRSDAALCCAGLLAGKTPETSNRAQPGPESSA